MNYPSEELEDLATMRELRQRLRVIAEAKIAECEAMEAAKNWLDMNRQIKAIMSADRMIVALYSPPPRCGRSSSGTQPRSPISNESSALKAAPSPSSPPHFPNGEVSAGASRQMTEGSNAVEIPPLPPEIATDPEFTAIAEGATREVTRRINGMTRRYARSAGIWPDHAPFHETEANWQVHTLTAVVPFSLDDDFDPTSWIRGEMLNRANAIAEAQGKSPTHWMLSANLNTGNDHPAEGETRSPSELPWWIIRKPPP